MLLSIQGKGAYGRYPGYRILMDAHVDPGAFSRAAIEQETVGFGQVQREPAAAVAEGRLESAKEESGVVRILGFPGENGFWIQKWPVTRFRGDMACGS